MSVNDIVTSGAKPLFFLDYFATSRLDVDLAEKVHVFMNVIFRFGIWIICQCVEDVKYFFLFFLQVIKGIVDGCRQSDCALLGGEVCFPSHP